jgi:NADPH:quinone reductase-like Zn-dependent oxidoreductase
MKAIVQTTYGPPEILEFREIAKPSIGDDDVLLRVCAAGMDPSVWHLMTGLPYVARLMFGLRKPGTLVPGWDVSGVVEAVGRNVTDVHPGDEVFGICKGAFAEYASARAEKLMLKPANVALEHAAAIAISGCTALQALRNAGKVQPGHHVLVIGAGGGVGTYAVQIAKAFGAKVTGVCSAAKTDMVRTLGADDVIDYSREDFADGSRHYDLILDMVGDRPVGQILRALTPRGTLVAVGGEGGGTWFGGIGESLLWLLLSAFMRRKFRSLMAAVNKEDLLTLKELIEAGKVRPVIDRTYPLHDAPAAIRAWMQGHARGKVLISTHQEGEAP